MASQVIYVDISKKDIPGWDWPKLIIQVNSLQSHTRTYQDPPIS